MIDKFLKYLRFFGFPKKEDCLVRKVTLRSIYKDVIVVCKWMYPDHEPEDEASVKKALLSAPGWLNFISQYKTGDELWYFNFPDKMWKKLKGMNGYIILRNSKYIDYFWINRN